MKRILILTRAEEFHAWLAKFIEDARLAGYLDSFLCTSLRLHRKPCLADVLHSELKHRLQAQPNQCLKPLCSPLDEAEIVVQDLLVALALAESGELIGTSTTSEDGVRSTPWMSQDTERHTALDLLLNRNLQSASIQTSLMGKFFASGRPEARLEKLLGDYDESRKAFRFLKERLSESLQIVLWGCESPMDALIRLYRAFHRKDKTAKLLQEEMDSIKQVDYPLVMNYLHMKAKWFSLLRACEVDFTPGQFCEGFINGLSEEYASALETQLKKASMHSPPTLSDIFDMLEQFQRMFRENATAQEEDI